MRDICHLSIEILFVLLGFGYPRSVWFNTLRQTEFIISADSGLMHLAYGLGVKTLSLFGAGIEGKWGPKGKNNFIIKCFVCFNFASGSDCG